MNTHNPSLFIREHLLSKEDTAYNTWKAYNKSTGSRITFQSFLKYVGMVKRLGLIEQSKTIDAGLGKGDIPAPYRKATLLKIKDADSEYWNNPYKALYK